jgi:phosphatidylserine decarboxylase
VLGSYTWLYSINQSDLPKPLDTFESINDLITRKPNNDTLKLDEESLISPCEGTITSFGVVSNKLESIKGIHYTFTQLLTGDQLDFDIYREGLLKSKENELYYLTIYLSGGDSHRFYSPCDWEVVFRRHIFGYLHSLLKWNQVRKREVLNNNERVAYFGRWKFGAFYYVAVASFGVGDISVWNDPELSTNLSDLKDVEEKMIEKKISSNLKKGQDFGVFSAGSTIVLVFEGPKDLKWAVGVNDRVKIGNKLVIGL